MKQDIIAFIILHYNCMEDTINCVNSIRQVNFGERYYIIIVDNASPNESGESLLYKYQKDDDVRVILLTENVGFAKGNNAGYVYAKKECGANFIIVANNDIIFNDSWKFDHILEIYDRTQADIIGPDIISGEGEHWNPLRLYVVADTKFVKKRIRNRKIVLFYYGLKKKSKIMGQCGALERWMAKDRIKRLSRTAYKEERKGVVLHGACILFTPSYVRREDTAFNPKTFMYGEEDLLSQRAKKRGYDMLYTPKLSVLHIGEQATRSIYIKDIDKEIFMHSNMLKGYQILFEELKSD